MNYWLHPEAQLDLGEAARPSLPHLPPARPARSGEAVVDGGLDRGLFRLPQPGVVGDEAFAVDRQLRDEGIVGPAGATLVAVGPIPRPAIDLLERLEGELGQAEPGGADGRLLADFEAEAADRQQVRRRGEAQVDVRATGDRPALGAVPFPAPQGRMDPESDLERLVADRALDPRREGPPFGVADHPIGKPAGPPAFDEGRVARQVPAVVAPQQQARVVTGVVETAPEDRGLHRPYPPGWPPFAAPAAPAGRSASAAPSPRSPSMPSGRAGSLTGSASAFARRARTRWSIRAVILSSSDQTVRACASGSIWASAGSSGTP